LSGFSLLHRGLRVAFSIRLLLFVHLTWHPHPLSQEGLGGFEDARLP
jgi:hypothetical protein